MRNLFSDPLNNTTVILTGVTPPTEDVGFVGILENRLTGAVFWTAYVRPQGYEIRISHTLRGRPLSRIRMGMSLNWDLGTSVAHVFMMH